MEMLHTLPTMQKKTDCEKPARLDFMEVKQDHFYICGRAHLKGKENRGAGPQ